MQIFRTIRAETTITIARHNAMHAERDTVLPILSVCLSNVGTVSKLMDISSHFFVILLGASFSAGVLNTRGGKIFANIALYLRNGTE